jgi:lipid-A-disaccharide synthase-like uncharacterized protein
MDENPRQSLAFPGIAPAFSLISRLEIIQTPALAAPPDVDRGRPRSFEMVCLISVSGRPLKTLRFLISQKWFLSNRQRRVDFPSD